MADDRITLQPYNFRELARALRQAPDLVFRFVRSEWGRAGRRWRRFFIKERLSGRPGILWRKKNTIGRNVRGDVAGKSIRDLRVTLGISRFLRVHDEGATITPQRGEWLYLSTKTGRKGQGTVVARKKSVLIPPRLGFRAHVERFLPDVHRRTEERTRAAVRVAVERRLRAIQNLTRSVRLA